MGRDDSPETHTTVGAQVDDLVAAGYQPQPQVFASDSGRRLEPGQDSDSWLLHLIARR